MARVRTWIARLRRVFGGPAPGSDTEIRHHLDLLTEHYIRQGMSPDHASHAARRQFGNLTRLREDWRYMQTRPRFESIWRDLGHAGRMLRRDPGLSLAIVLTLALGIGGNTAVFSVYNAVLLKPLPYPDSDPRRWESHASGRFCC